MKVINITGLTWAQIVDCPWKTSYAGSVINAAFACVVNGYFCMIYATDTPSSNSPLSGTWVAYLFDELGNICTFQSPDFVNNVQVQMLTQQVFQGGNRFTINYPGSGKGTRVFTLPNIFVPGKTFIVPTSAIAVPPSPCGIGGYTKSRYLSAQGYTTYEYIQTFSVNNNTWASIYEGANLVGGGYIGNYVASFDPFDQFALQLPPGVSGTNVWQKNGLNVFSLMGEGTYNQQVYGWSQPYLMGDPTSLVCGGPGNPTVFITGINTFQQYAQANGMPAATFTSANCIPPSTTDSTIYFGLGQYVSGTCAVLSRDYWINIPRPPAAPVSSMAGFGLMTQRKKLFYMSDDPGGLNKRRGPLFVANFDLNALGIGPLPIVQQTGHNGLVNMSRAVSINGSFIT